MTRPERVSIDDLLFAIDWLDSYDGKDKDGTISDNDRAAKRVAEWLMAEIQRRKDTALVRSLASEHNVSVARVRAIMRQANANKA